MAFNKERLRSLQPSKVLIQDCTQTLCTSLSQGWPSLGRRRVEGPLGLWRAAGKGELWNITLGAGNPQLRGTGRVLWHRRIPGRPCSRPPLPGYSFLCHCWAWGEDLGQVFGEGSTTFRGWKTEITGQHQSQNKNPHLRTLSTSGTVPDLGNKPPPKNHPLD